jgi:hypothetical protein
MAEATAEKKKRTRTKAAVYLVERMRAVALAEVEEAESDVWCGVKESGDYRAAEKWLRDNAEDGVKYRIVRVLREATAKKVVEEKIKLS